MIPRRSNPALPVFTPRRRRATGALTATLLAVTLLAACGARRGPKPFTPASAAKQSAPERDFWQMPAVVVQKMGVRKGMHVLDLGAGSGYMLPWLSRAVGEGGVVWAAEVQPDLVTLLEQRVAREGLKNVRVVLSTRDSVPLPSSVDRVLLLNTYTQLSDPIGMLKAVRLLLRPGGRLAVIDTLPFEDVPGPPLDERLSLDTVVAEARGAGFVESMQFKVLPRQYFALFIHLEEVDTNPVASPEEPPSPQPPTPGHGAAHPGASRR